MGERQTASRISVTQDAETRVIWATHNPSTTYAAARIVFGSTGRPGTSVVELCQAATGQGRCPNA